MVIYDCSAVPGIEYSALKMLIESEEKRREQGIEIWLTALNPEVKELVLRTPLAERLGNERTFFTVEQAVDAFMAHKA